MEFLAGNTGTISKRVKDDLMRAGFTINETKSNFTPQQKGIWLGFIIDTIKFIFAVPDSKI